MQEVLYFTYTGNFYVWILLPGREIYFLGLVPKFVANLPIMFASSEIGCELRNKVRKFIGSPLYQELSIELLIST